MGNFLIYESSLFAAEQAVAVHLEAFLAERGLLTRCRERVRGKPAST
jgi:hypothetical protein